MRRGGTSNVESVRASSVVSSLPSSACVVGTDVAGYISPCLLCTRCQLGIGPLLQSCAQHRRPDRARPPLRCYSAGHGVAVAIVPDKQPIFPQLWDKFLILRFRFLIRCVRFFELITEIWNLNVGNWVLGDTNVYLLSWAWLFWVLVWLLSLFSKFLSNKASKFWLWKWIRESGIVPCAEHKFGRANNFYVRLITIKLEM